MNTVFKRIKSELKEMYDLLKANPEQENHIKKDMLIAQQVISDSLKKLKRNIAYYQYNSEKKLFK